VLSEHFNAVLVATKIAAAHYACGHFLRQATAFDATASVDNQPPDRAF
jgi:hypothetical protein